MLSSFIQCMKLVRTDLTRSRFMVVFAPSITYDQFTLFIALSQCRFDNRITNTQCVHEERFTNAYPAVIWLKIVLNIELSTLLWRTLTPRWPSTRTSSNILPLLLNTGQIVVIVEKLCTLIGRNVNGTFVNALFTPHSEAFSTSSNTIAGHVAFASVFL